MAGPAASSHDHDHGGGELRTVEEVRASILDRVGVLAPIELPLQEAWGCVLAADKIAEGDMPSFSSSAMDGFAVRAMDVSEAANPASLRSFSRNHSRPIRC